MYCRGAARYSPGSVWEALTCESFTSLVHSVINIVVLTAPYFIAISSKLLLSQPTTSTSCASNSPLSNQSGKGWMQVNEQHTLWSFPVGTLNWVISLLNLLQDASVLYHSLPTIAYSANRDSRR